MKLQMLTTADQAFLCELYLTCLLIHNSNSRQQNYANYTYQLLKAIIFQQFLFCSQIVYKHYVGLVVC